MKVVLGLIFLFCLLGVNILIVPGRETQAYEEITPPFLASDFVMPDVWEGHYYTRLHAVATEKTYVDGVLALTTVHNQSVKLYMVATFIMVVIIPPYPWQDYKQWFQIGYTQYAGKPMMTFYADWWIDGYYKVEKEIPVVGSEHELKIMQDWDTYTAFAYLDNVEYTRVYFSYPAESIDYQICSESTCVYNHINFEWAQFRWHNYYGDWEKWDGILKEEDSPYWVEAGYMNDEWYAHQGGGKSAVPTIGTNGGVPHLKR